jgi:hypothetical protein
MPGARVSGGLWHGHVQANRQHRGCLYGGLRRRDCGSARQGVVGTVIVATLAEIAIKTVVAEKDHAQMHLDALAAITRAAADVHRAVTVINVAQAIFADA